MGPERKRLTESTAPLAAAAVAAQLADLRLGADQAVDLLAGELAAAIAGGPGVAPVSVVDTAHLESALVRSGGPGAAVLIGQVYECLLGERQQRRSGAHYTPSGLAGALVAATFDGCTATPTTVLDPTCGGGVFLVAAAEYLRRATGAAHHDVVGRLRGRDLDPVAVSVTTHALRLWCLEGSGAPPAALDVAVMDGLVDEWPAADAIVGNPPFLNQLDKVTSHDPERRALLRRRFGAASGAYTDVASLFLLRAVDVVAPGGRVMLIQPQSLLAARDAAAVRSTVLGHADLVGLWFSAEQVFDASVDVWAPILERHQPTGRAHSSMTSRHIGPDVVPGHDVAAPASDDDSWGRLVADILGVPAVVGLQSAPQVIGDLADATAGFRDEFYGFAPYTVEQADLGARDTAEDASGWPLAMTVGMIDPLWCRWGTAEFRYAKKRWDKPVIDLGSLRCDEPRLAAWTSDRLRPKLVVATQTRVIETAVDAAGTWVPITPVISVEPHDDDPTILWRLAALLSTPALSAHVMTTRLGAALSVSAIKVSASEVTALPLPTDPGAWAEGALIAQAAMAATSGPERRAHLGRLGTVMNRSYGLVDTDLERWWLDRIPARPDATD